METKARFGAKEAHILLLVLLMLSDMIGSPVYSIAVVLYAAVLTVMFDPVYLLPACFLTTTIQSYFLITPSLSFSRILSLMFLAGCIIYKRTYYRSKLSLFLIVFAFYHVCSIFWSVSGNYTEPVSFAIGIAMVLFMASHKVDKTIAKDVYDLLFFMAYGFGMLLIILTIIKHRELEGTQIVFDENLNANTICSTLGMFASMVYGKTLNQNAWRKWLNYLFVLVCAATILIVGSRTALLTLIAVIIVLPFVIGKPEEGNAKRIITVIAFTLVALGVVYDLMLAEPELYKRFTFDPSTTRSVDRRIYVWEALIKHIIPSNLWLGIGYGLENVRQAVTPYVSMVYHSHNMYLAILSELGLVGMAQYLFLFAHVFTNIRRCINPGTVLALGLLLTGFVLGIGEEVINRRWFWLSVGFAYMFMRNHDAFDWQPDSRLIFGAK